MIGVSTIARDITDRKRMEEEVRAAGQIKAEFISMVSHELRTPLAVIQEGVDLVLDGTAGPLTANQHDYLQIAKRNTDRLTRLIHNVLDYQKLDAGRAEFPMQPEDLNAIIQETLTGFILLAEKKGLQLKSHLADGLPPIHCAKDMIVQVLTNLLNNAIKFCEQGCVTVTSERGDNWVRFAVHNDGPGITAEDQPKLFQSFSQLSHNGGGRKIGGTGLGLAISKKIVEKHRGQIAVLSAPGQGVTFSVTVPITERRG